MGLFDKQKKDIKKVKYLGVRMSEETKVFGTVNSSLYSFLVEYMDGERKILQFSAGDEKIQELLYYINMD